MSTQIFKRRDRWQTVGLPAAASALYILVLVATLIFAPKGSEYSLWDFRAYYDAGRAVLTNPSNLYNDPKTVVMGFVNLPIIAYLFAPFAWLNYRSAEVLFLTLSCLSILAFSFYTVQWLNLAGWRRLAWIGLIAASHPLFNCLRFGNTTHFILLLLLGCLYGLQRQRKIQAGVLLAIAALIKIPLGFLIIFLVVRREWKALIAFVSTGAIAVSLSLVVFGLDLNRVWLERCILAFAGKAIPAYNVQSISGFLSRLTTTIPLNLPESWTPVILAAPFKLLQSLLIALLIGVALWVCWRSKRSETAEATLLDFSIFLTVGIVISPISWTHYYLLFLLPFAFCLAGKLILPKGKSWLILTLLSVVLIQLPPIHKFFFQSSSISIFISNLLVSHNLVGALLLLGVLLVTRRRLPSLLISQP